MLMEALVAAGLSRLEATLQALARPSIRVLAHEKSDSDIPLGHSKMGGCPDLPTGWSWPTMRRRDTHAQLDRHVDPPIHDEGIPLAFVCQINLREASPCDSQQLLPQIGMLYFFTSASQHSLYDLDMGEVAPVPERWRVLYFCAADASGNLTRMPFPASLSTEARYQPQSIAYAAEITLPNCAFQWDHRTGLLSNDMGGYWNEPMLDETECDLYWRLQSQLANYFDKEPHPPSLHRMLGYPDLVQNPMELECQLESQGIPLEAAYPDLWNEHSGLSEAPPQPGVMARAAALKAGASDWLLLLQVDSNYDDDAMTWGDVGRIYYWIRRSDLEQRDFSHVWHIVQSG